MMKIYNKQPIEVLYDLVSPLKQNIPDIFKEIMSEDENSVPESYILLRTEINDLPSMFGDGKVKVRMADCDVILTSKGTAENSDSLHNINKTLIANCLIQEEINFQGHNLGYDSTNNNTQYSFSFKVYYV